MVDWYESPSNFHDGKLFFWCVDPSRPRMRWHVSYREAGTQGILEADGWCWYAADYQDNRFSSLFGPFSSAEAARADCETAHRQDLSG